MGNEQLISVQRKFAVYHRDLLIFACVNAMIEIFQTSRCSSGYFLAVFGIIFLTNAILIRKPILRVSVMSVYRYSQLLCGIILFCLVNTKAPLLYVLTNLFILLSMTEIFLLLDPINNYFKYTNNFVMCIISVLTVSFFATKNQFDIFIICGYFAMLFIDLILANVISIQLINYMNETKDKISSQTQIISNMEKMNEELHNKEEKVRKAYEEVEHQKEALIQAKNQMQNINTEMMIQNEIVRYISSSLEIKKLMDLIVDSLIGVIGANIAGIVLYPGATDNAEPEYNIRTTKNSAFETMFTSYVIHGCFDPFIDNNLTFVDNHVKKGQYDFLLDAGVGSLVIVPLIKGGTRIGALCVAHPNEEYFTENKQFFEGIVAQFLIALENANLYMRMEKMATKDGLTGVYNRGYLTKLLSEALNDAVLNKTCISLALFDIDHFKLINDNYGHLAGDAVIKMLAKKASDIAEKNFGFVGRFGGEEFVILFPEKNMEEALSPVEELRKTIKETPIVHNGKNVNITISIGLTCYPETCQNPSELLNRADWAMYYSKQSGRNQITIDSDEIQQLVKMH